MSFIIKRGTIKQGTQINMWQSHQLVIEQPQDRRQQCTSDFMHT